MNKKYIIIGVITSLLLLGVGIIVNNRITIQNAKNDMLYKQLEQTKNSDEIILVNLIKKTKAEIVSLDNVIKTSQENLKNKKAFEICYKQQMDRLLNSLEYNISYCNDNLEQFQGLR